MFRLVPLILFNIVFLLGFLNPSLAAIPEIERLINEGITYHNNRNYLLAIKSFVRAHDLDPNNLEVKSHLSTAHNNYGKYLAERTDSVGAIREFRTALYYGPENEIARSNLEFKLKADGYSVTDALRRVRQAHSEREASNHFAAIAELNEANRLSPTAEAYIEMGQVYHVLYLRNLNKKDYAQQAITAFEKAEALEPNDVLSYIGRGDVYIAQNAISKGIDFYEAAIAKDPNNAKAQAALISGWLAAIRVAPHLPNNHVGLGTAYQIQGDFTQAERSFRRALQIEPSNPIAQSSLDALHQSMMKAQTGSFLQKAVELQKEARYDESLAYYIKALNSEPENPDIHYNIGTVFQAKHDIARAEKAYTRTLELKADHAEAKAALAMVTTSRQEQDIAEAFKHAIKLQEMGNYPQAIEVYSKIAADRPNDDALFYNIATAYQAMANYDKAIENYTKANSLKPDSTYSELIRSVKAEQANQILDSAIRDQGAGNYEAAISAYKKVISMVEGNAGAWYNLGTAYQAAARNKEALDAYQQAFKLDPVNQSEALFFSAIILEEQRKLMEAIDMYNKYIANAPTGAYVKDAKARQDYIKSFL